MCNVRTCNSCFAAFTWRFEYWLTTLNWKKIAFHKTIRSDTVYRWMDANSQGNVLAFFDMMKQNLTLNQLRGPGIAWKYDARNKFTSTGKTQWKWTAKRCSNLISSCHFLLTFSINCQIIAQAWLRLGRRFSCCGLKRQMLTKVLTKWPWTFNFIVRK